MLTILTFRYTSIIVLSGGDIIERGNRIQKEIELYRMELEALEKQLIKRLESAPNGYIKITGTLKYKYYYWHNSGLENQPNPTYISTGNHELITALIQKSYDKQLLKRVKDELKAINSGADKITGNLDEVYNNLTDIRKKYVHPYRLTDELFSAQWLAIPNPGNPTHPEQLILETLNKEKVRSKSERSIANALFRKNIPYKFENPLHIDGYGTYYPDFTILDMKTRSLVYWEHFGRIDDPDYANKAARKLKAFSSKGIVPRKNLIITIESSDCPLDQPVIDKIIKSFS